MTDQNIKDILDRLSRCTAEQRRQVLLSLRQEFPIHELETAFGVSAETILEAIGRASDLTQRGVRGVIAEAEFGAKVASPLITSGWRITLLEGDLLYDYELVDSVGPVRVQVKMQRREARVPKMAYGMYVVETQKTRSGGGTNAEGDKTKTRPYRFGDFDILAVCMEPSTKRWSDFMYTVESWLVPKIDDPSCLQTFQYIPTSANDEWTDDFLTAVEWFRSAEKKTVAGRNPANRGSSTFSPIMLDLNPKGRDG